MTAMHYLSIIRKAEFIDLFKYGQLTVYSVTEFDGNVEAHANDKDLFQKLTSGINLYEYSFEYLIIHFLDKKNNSPLVVDIEKVIALYTFDEEAKREMSISFDPRIKLNVSPWTKLFSEWHQNLLITQNMRGIDNLWSILDLPKSDRKKCELIITDKIVSEAFHELYANKRPHGELSIWVYLLRYERHSFYPKDTIRGYFCDSIHVVINWMIKKEGEENERKVKATDIYKQIQSHPKDSFLSLCGIVQNSKFDQSIKKGIRDECNFVKVAPLFLYLKDKFTTEFDIKQLLSYGNKDFDFSLAIYLLGLTLGYDKTYDVYYNRCNNKQGLLIFMGKEKAAKIVYEKEKKKKVPSDSQEELLLDEKPIYMRKIIGKKRDLKQVHNDDEKAKLIKDGYKPVKKLTDNDKKCLDLAKQNAEIPLFSQNDNDNS